MFYPELAFALCLSWSSFEPSGTIACFFMKPFAFLILYSYHFPLLSISHPVAFVFLCVPFIESYYLIFVSEVTWGIFFISVLEAALIILSLMKCAKKKVMQTSQEEEFCLLGYNDISIEMKLLPPSPGSKSKLSKKSAWSRQQAKLACSFLLALLSDP